MDSGLTSALDAVVAQSNALGLLCVDANGLTLGARGTAPSNAGGYVAAVLSQARQLDASAVVVLETDNNTILMRAEDDMSMAIFKNRE